MHSLILATTLLFSTASGVEKAYSTFEDAHYSGSGVCADCHDGLSTSTGEDISIAKAWSNSMMGNSTVDPYWQAKVAAELDRNPALADEINHTCSRCHAPMANDAASKNGDPVQILGAGGFLDPASPYYQHAIEGVSCTLCHQIADDGNLGTLEGISGKWTVNTYTNLVDRPAYGQYPDPSTRAMRNNVLFTPQRGDHTVTSEMCATCHDLKTPFVDAQGQLAAPTPESEFPEQMVYSEWKHSAFADPADTTTCQDCHMPVVDEAVTIATRGAMGRTRTDFRRHTFHGANTVMQQMLLDNGLAPNASNLAAAIEENRAFLQQAATIRLLDAQVRDGTLLAEVVILNRTGHKLPSGYPSRRVWVEFIVTDGNGNTLFHSGALNSDGSIAGVAVDEDNSTYEPHYQTITRADQVQVYEPIMANTDGEVTHTLLRAASYLKDNRLLPVGFDKSTAPADVAVHGTAAEDADFVGGSDRLRYEVPVGKADRYQVQVRLRYQTLSFGHIQDLLADDHLPEVATFKTYFEQASIRAETLSEDRRVARPWSAPVGSGKKSSPAITAAKY